VSIFAIELSSRFGSVAWIKDGEVILQKQWQENMKNRQQLFDAIEALKTEVGFHWEEVDAFAVGRGPGAFSGMRISLSVAQSLAKPGNRPVYALNSGYAMALAAMKTVGSVLIVGDARRQQVWAGRFYVDAGQVELTEPFALMSLEEFTEKMISTDFVAGPDQDRLQKSLIAQGIACSNESVFPDAGTLGVLVEKWQRQGYEFEPLEPLYMHPAVFIEPRFSA
jgi:tRNA threonylcarbamoyl adenosine modification protein YeaZ